MCCSFGHFQCMIFVCLCYVVLRKFPSPEHSPVPGRAFCSPVRHGAPGGRTKIIGCSSLEDTLQICITLVC